MSLNLRRRRPDAPCRCGHTHSAHEHLRPGTDCALGEPGHCTHFRAARAHRPTAVLRRRRHRHDDADAGALAPVVPVVTIPAAAQDTPAPQPSPRRRTSA